MASENTITIIGNLADDPDLRFTGNGVAVTNLRVAVNRRMRNQQTNEWEDILDGFFTVNVWRDMAENVAASLRKGQRVMVIGRLRSRSYEDRDGQTQWVTEIEADDVAASFRWAQATITKAVGGKTTAPRAPHPAGEGATRQRPAEDTEGEGDDTSTITLDNLPEVDF